MCVLHQFVVPSVGVKSENLSIKDKPIYVGVIPHSHRLVNDKMDQEKKEGDENDAEEEKGEQK